MEFAYFDSSLLFPHNENNIKRSITHTNLIHYYKKTILKKFLVIRVKIHQRITMKSEGLMYTYI